MIVRIRTLIVVLCLLLAGTMISRAGEAPALRAIATTDVTEVHPDDVFDVTLSLQNLSGATQTIHIPDAGWDRCWKSSNGNVTWDFLDGSNASQTTVQIPPHQTYEFSMPLKMFVAEGYRQSRISFKMGFKTGGFGKAVWSAPISLDVTP
jgi:hypothetical protein